MLINKMKYIIKKYCFVITAILRQGSLIIGKNVVFSGKQVLRISSKGKCLIKDNCTFSDDVYLTVNGGNLTIGTKCFFNYNCNIMCIDSISIGDGCLFGGNVTIVDNDHNYREYNFDNSYITDSIEIGEKCWIGSNVVIMKGTKIGNNCVIGSGSIVKGHIDNNSVLVQKRENIVKKYNKLPLDRESKESNY